MVRGGIRSMAIELSTDALSEQARFVILESYVQQQQFSGADPLNILLELEQLATAEGYSDIQSFIESL